MRRAAAVGAVVAALSFAACGEGDDPASEAPTTAPPDTTLSAPETPPEDPKDPAEKD